MSNEEFSGTQRHRALARKPQEPALDAILHPLEERSFQLFQASWVQEVRVIAKVVGVLPGRNSTFA